MGLSPKPDGRLTLDTNGFHVLLEACGEKDLSKTQPSKNSIYFIKAAFNLAFFSHQENIAFLLR